MNALAWQYHEQGRDEDAVLISRIAVDLKPDDANFLDTLAAIELQRGETATALSLLEKAAALDPAYGDKLRQYRDAASR
jgi:Flp pilus assembly protein TadD